MSTSRSESEFFDEEQDGQKSTIQPYHDQFEPRVNSDGADTNAEGLSGDESMK